jgi:hypothetical protein
MKVYKIQNEKEEIMVKVKQFISKSCSHSEKKFIIQTNQNYPELFLRKLGEDSGVSYCAFKKVSSILFQSIDLRSRCQINA